MTFKFRVVSLSEYTNDRVTVQFTQDVEGADANIGFSQSLTLNLTEEEASAYFPGQVYTLTLTADA